MHLTVAEYITMLARDDEEVLFQYFFCFFALETSPSYVYARIPRNVPHNCNRSCKALGWGYVWA